MQGLKEALEYGRKEGWSGLVKTFFKKAKVFLFVKEEFILSYMPLDSIPDVKPERQVVIRDATWDDMPKLKKVNFNTKDFADWLKRGCMFTIALNSDKVVSYLCMHTEPLPPFDKVVKLKP